MRGELASVTSAQINQYGVARRTSRNIKLQNLYCGVSLEYYTTILHYGVASTTLFTSESITSDQPAS